MSIQKFRKNVTAYIYLDSNNYRYKKFCYNAAVDCDCIF